MFVVIFTKVTDDKKNGVQIQGPIVGPTRDNIEQAEEEARAIINTNRNCTVIPRIYEIGSLADIGHVLNDAKAYFNNMYSNMLEAKEAMSRPVHRKRRRKVVVAQEDEKDDTNEAEKAE